MSCRKQGINLLRWSQSSRTFLGCCSSNSTQGERARESGADQKWRTHKCPASAGQRLLCNSRRQRTSSTEQCSTHSPNSLGSLPRPNDLRVAPSGSPATNPRFLRYFFGVILKDNFDRNVERARKLVSESLLHGDKAMKACEKEALVCHGTKTSF